MKSLKLILPILGFASCFSSCNSVQPSAADSILISRKHFLSTNTHVAMKPVFIPLSPGAVVPRGWLNDYARSAASGTTGHLDEMSPTFGQAWKGIGFKAPGADPVDGTGWPLEQCSYWLDGAVRLAYILNDTALIKKISTRLNIVVDGILNGGETFVYWKPKEFLAKDGFNSWAHSHMGRALVAYYQATADKRILNALVKVYSKFYLPSLPFSFDDTAITGAVNADAMLQTYQMSGNDNILNIVLKMTESPMYKSTLEKWNNGDVSVGHGVICYESIRIPAMIYPWTGNKSDIRGSEKCFEWLDKFHLLPCGLPSAEEHNAGIGATRSIETCDVAASAWAYQQVYQVTGDAKYGDRIEKIFFNTSSAPVARDYKTMAYYQTPNRVQDVMPSQIPCHPGKNSGASPFLFRSLGHPVLCCVSNLARVIPNYIMHIWMATLDDGVAATLYGPCSLNTVAGKENTKINIKTITDYPFGETIVMQVTPSESVAFPMYLRIPAWCSNPSIKLNGKSIKYSDINGFAKIEREWAKGDLIELKFPMILELVEGKETPFSQTPYFTKPGNRDLCGVKEISNPFQSILYGPLLFALPLIDIDPNQQVQNEKWKYALDVKNSLDSVKIERTKMPDFWDWPLEAPIKLVVGAKSFDWVSTELQPMPKQKVKNGLKTRITLIPYGCTKFRISMFPVSDEN